MYSALEEATVHCPYCGEPLSVLLNPEDLGQEYIEDCQVCCRPIEFMISEAPDGGLWAQVSTDTD